MQNIEAVAFLLVLLVAIPGSGCMFVNSARVIGFLKRKEYTYAYRIAALPACVLVALLLVLVSYPTCSAITGSESLKP